MGLLKNDKQQGWQTKVYITGALGGLLFGVLSAYLYNRAAEEEALVGDGTPPSIQLGTVFGLALTVFGLLRQIAESARNNSK
jgi:hypothetical protein